MADRIWTDAELEQAHEAVDRLLAFYCLRDAFSAAGEREPEVKNETLN